MARNIGTTHADCTARDRCKVICSPITNQWFFLTPNYLMYVLTYITRALQGSEAEHTLQGGARGSKPPLWDLAETVQRSEKRQTAIDSASRDLEKYSGDFNVRLISKFLGATMSIYLFIYLFIYILFIYMSIYLYTHRETYP